MLLFNAQKDVWIYGDGKTSYSCNTVLQNILTSLWWWYN